jgi:hypothetical protein
VGQPGGDGKKKKEFYLFDAYPALSRWAKMWPRLRRLGNEAQGKQSAAATSSKKRKADPSYVGTTYWEEAPAAVRGPMHFFLLFWGATCWRTLRWWPLVRLPR